MATWADKLRAGRERKEDDRERESAAAEDDSLVKQAHSVARASNVEGRLDGGEAPCSDAEEARHGSGANGSPRVEPPSGKKVVLDSGMLIKGERIDKLGEHFWTVI